MTIAVYGLSHATSSIALRERISFRRSALPRALCALSRECDGAESAILNTCNRIELYLYHDELSSQALAQSAAAFLEKWHGLSASEFDSACYAHAHAEAGEHLFRVTAGLDSLVIGETQILGQVRSAYETACAAETAGKTLHALFQKALAAAKRVQTQTGITRGNVSISSVAVALAAQCLGGLAGKTAMVIGSGKMGELTLRCLTAQGAGRVIAVNRDLHRARSMGRAYGGIGVTFAELDAHLPETDALITATSAPHFVLDKPRLQRALTVRTGRPLAIIDIAAPRDVDPAAEDLPGLHLYNVDDLRSVADAGLEERRQHAERAACIVQQAAADFMARLEGAEADPAIISIGNEVRAIKDEELDRSLAALGLSPAQEEGVRRMTRRIVNRILHSPMTGLKEEITHHDPKTVIHLARRLFGLKD